MRGGPRPGSGRKSKAEEQELQKKLDPMEPDFLDALLAGIKKGNPLILKMYAEYRFGKPQDSVDITSKGEKIEGTKEIIFRNYADPA